MTNSELITVFKMLREDYENIFDIYEELEKYEELYKEMKISKIKPTIYDAYELYCNNENKVVEAIKYILYNVDFSVIADAFNIGDLIDQIPVEYRDVFGQLIKDTLDK